MNLAVLVPDESAQPVVGGFELVEGLADVAGADLDTIAVAGGSAERRGDVHGDRHDSPCSIAGSLSRCSGIALRYPEARSRRAAPAARPPPPRTPPTRRRRRRCRPSSPPRG